MTRGLTKIRCEECGNDDPARFHRIYVEASRERIVDGDWVVEVAWEHADGQETYTFCDECGSEGADETYGELPARVPSALAEVTQIVAEAVANDGRLTLLEDDPERDHVALSVATSNPARNNTSSDAFRLGVEHELRGREVSA